MLERFDATTFDDLKKGVKWNLERMGITRGDGVKTELANRLIKKLSGSVYRICVCRTPGSSQKVFYM